MDTAPKDGTRIVARIAKAVWESGRENGPFIAGIRWNGSDWVLAEMFHEDATLTVSGWIPPGSSI
jgi:hypothetical protein